MRTLGLVAVVAVLAAMFAALPGTAFAQSGPVLVVGDSLEVGTGPHLRRELSSVPVTVDARTGRPSSEGVRVLRERIEAKHEVVVFDLGTNDDPSQSATFARNLARARDIAGNRCLVVATLNRPPVNGVSVDVMNRTVQDFVEATPDARLVDWERAVARDPSLLASDGVHATPIGYQERARLVAAGVEECFGAEEPPTQSSRNAPEPEPRAGLRSGPGGAASGGGGSWAGLIALTPYDLLAGWVRGVADTVITAAQNVSGALGDLPPEVELGAPPPPKKGR